jgi:excisionase family DNA binding protein
MVSTYSSTHSLNTLLDNHLSVNDAAEYSGYNLQYLRRLVRAGAIRAVKIGQMWLVDIRSLDAYLRSVRHIPVTTFNISGV